jgi:hypothetical protein
MLGMRFAYTGDDGSRIISWFEEHLRAIASCLDGGLPEAGLILIYSGIDTLGLLAAPADFNDATRDTFKNWCEKYLLARLPSIEGRAVAAVDLWAARCGVLHTSTPVSRLSREGGAHEIWYQFQGKAGVNLIMNAKLEPLGVEIEKFAMAFKEGGLAFITDLSNDSTCHQVAAGRAQHFLRWGTRE